MDIGTQVGSYRIDGLLGRGGMAEVYKAWHLNLHRYEALKALPPQMTFDRSFVERFLQEARTAAQLHHPNIATIHAVSDDTGPQFYFAMELVEGGDLADLLAQRGAIPLDESLSILRQAAKALDYAHSRGVIHRDVKPGNILLGSDSSGICVKMVDFGIARAQAGEGATRLTRTGMIVGTPEYMSPEQAGSGAPVDQRSDLYSLGVVAYEMLCGQPPFHAQTDTSPMSVLMAHVRDLPRPPFEHVPGLPVAVNNAVLKALAKDPRDRFATCADFMDALSGAITVSPPVPPVLQNETSLLPPPPNPSPVRANPLPLILGLAVLLGIGLIALGLYNHGTHQPIEPPTGPTSTTTGTPTTTGGPSTTGGPTTSSSGGPSTSSTGSSTSGDKPTPAAVTVPDLNGVSEDQAKELAAGKGLKLEVTTGDSDSTPAGKVIRQNPSAGEAANKGDTVIVRVSVGPPPSPPSAPTDTEYSWTDSRSVTTSDLQGKSAWELTLMRNAIYARHGYIFQRGDLSSHFNSKPWYHPTISSMDEVSGMLSELERQNASAIADYQDSHGLRG